MTTQLITNWSEHDSFLLKILIQAARTLHIFDQDLAQLKLDRADGAESLRRFLGADRNNRLSIVVKDAEPVQRSNPRLMKLLATYPHSMTLVECPKHLASLNDSMLIADDRHALIRFHLDHARAKAIIDSTEECLPYVLRFKEITKEGGEQISATPLGL